MIEKVKTQNKAKTETIVFVWITLRKKQMLILHGSSWHKEYQAT